MLELTYLYRLSVHCGYVSSMASLFMNKSFNIEEDAQEEDADKKKHKHESADHLRSRSLDSMPPVSSSTQHANNKNETTTIMGTSVPHHLMC